jgi:membrane dipeptidase
MNFPVFDLHCDTALELLGRKFQEIGSLRENELHIDLMRAKDFPAYVQCFACFTSDSKTLPIGIEPEELFRKEKNAILSQIDANADMIGQAFSVEDIEKHRLENRISAVLTIEGSAGIGFNPAALDDAYAAGFRITTLGWNESNPLAGSHKTGEGLSEKGKEYVLKAQNLGMLVDVSHISDAAFWDIMEITQGPVIASHSNSRSVWNVSRNLTDEMFLAIAQTGGVVGINLYAYFLGKEPDLDTVCDHIEHFLSLDPSGKHIALGGDLDGCEELPKGFAGIQDYQKLAQRLLERGMKENTVMDIFWNNAFELMKRTWK